MTTPPPQGNPFAQGQNPYGQGQQPYGQPQGQAPYPPQGQAPYPPQGGYPQQPGQPGFPPQGAGPYAPVPPQQPGGRFSFKKIKNIAVVVIVGIMMIVGYIISLDDAENAAVGDCLKSASTATASKPRMEVVDCSSSEAEAKVLKKIDGTYTSISAESECRKVSGATSFYAQTGDGDNFLLCLSAV